MEVNVLACITFLVGIVVGIAFMFIVENPFRMKVQLLFAWYDLWVGFFWDKKKRWLYFLPIPCVGIIVKFQK